jgi:DNA-directed RNA polymerase subunit E'
MFYITEVEDHIRVEPKLFGLPTIESVEQQLKETYVDYYDKEIGKVISIIEVLEVGEGVLIPGDGAAYYRSRFKLLVWRPELQELAYGIVSEITNFGAFIDLGAMKGMIHISQTMDDYVSFNKSNSLIGKASKRTLKQGDLCLARIVAISHKGGELKIGLTMRQPGLGKIEWIKEDTQKREKEAEKAERISKSEDKADKKSKEKPKGDKKKK